MTTENVPGMRKYINWLFEDRASGYSYDGESFGTLYIPTKAGRELVKGGAR